MTYEKKTQIWWYNWIVTGLAFFGAISLIYILGVITIGIYNIWTTDQTEKIIQDIIKNETLINELVNKTK